MSKPQGINRDESIAASRCYGLLAVASKARGYWLLLKVGGISGLLRYERERKVRERFYGRKFDPKADGIDLLHFIGASNAEIEEARKRGLA